MVIEREDIEVSDFSGWYHFLCDVSTFRDVNRRAGKVPSNHGRRLALPAVLETLNDQRNRCLLFFGLVCGEAEKAVSFSISLAKSGISNFRP